MSPVTEIRDFQSFWPFYVGEHRRPGCRIWHYAGTAAGSGLALAGLVTWIPWLIPVGLTIGYGCAWIGHFCVEGNRPATLRYPLWSFLADYKMFALAVTGRMRGEVARVCGEDGG